MKRVVCSNCGAEAHVSRGRYRFQESGLPNVVLRDIEMIRCPKCHNTDPVIPHLNELMRAIALRVIAKKCLLTGQEIRFLRKYLGMTGEAFCNLLHVDRATLSKWENDEDPVGPQSDRLIRVITIALGEGLQERLGELVRHFKDIQECYHPLRLNASAEALIDQAD
ncbi:MAG: hypothetical protein LAP13_07670 [Acidobacteriia bacterium]|nr:hypothetical protein [Terriglobia bacterium]